jgi:hypothetical protein
VYAARKLDARSLRVLRDSPIAPDNAPKNPTNKSSSVLNRQGLMNDRNIGGTLAKVPLDVK